MRKLILIIALFVCIPLQAAIPTMEGLFRNGKNKDLAGNFVILKMMVDEMSLTEEFEKKVSYLKFYFSVAAENRIEFLQVHYPDGEMRKDSATHLYYAHNLLWNLKKEQEDEKILFYSVMAMLGLNDSRPISYYLGKQSGDFKTNKKSMNWEKVNLLKKYKKYLAAKKENPELEEVSPLNPEDEETKEKVNEILAGPIYAQSEKVNLIRKENKFFWEVKLPTINALFSNEDHFIRELNIQTVKGPMVALFGEFMALNGYHYLPKEILIKDRSEKSYKVKILSYKVFSDPKKGLKERHKDFKKAVDKHEATLAGDVEVQKITDSFPNTFLYL
jgi:hypothetical protein